MLTPQSLGWLKGIDLTSNLVSSLLLFIGFVLLRVLVGRIFSRLMIENGEFKRKLYVYTKNSLSALFFVALVIIWAGKLESFALSLAAVAAAIAISFKEYFIIIK